MNCQECKDQFDALLSRQIAAERRSTAEAHLRQCAACARAFAEEQKLWELLGRAEKRPASLGFADRVLRQLDSKPAREPRWWEAWTIPWRWATAVAVLVAVLAVSSIAILRHQQIEKEKQARATHFEQLFSVAQVDDPDLILLLPLDQNGDTL